MRRSALEVLARAGASAAAAASAPPPAPSALLALVDRAGSVRRWAATTSSSSPLVVARGVSRSPPSLASSTRRASSRARAGGVYGPYAIKQPKRTESLRVPARDPLAGAPGEDPLAATRAERVVGFSSWTMTYLAIAALFVVPEAFSCFLEYQYQPKHEVGSLIENWSATKAVSVAKFVQPETLQELQRAVDWFHGNFRKLRPVGASLSPNGAAFSPEGMVSLTLMDKVLSVDKEKMRVTVQAGCTVRDLVEALRPHGMTLKNYASIREQQIGGFTQVGAHGTGATVPPIDETVVGMKLVTPGKGTLDLTIEDTPGILKMARCGIGSLGVAAEVTLECVPAERLLEETFTATRAEIEKNHATWLKRFKHVRYMWIPHTDVVVVVGSNPIPAEAPTPEPTTAFPEAKKVEPMARLLKRLNPDVDVTGMGFGELRDELLKIDPLDLNHVKRVNAAEGEFWKRNAGTRCDWSDQILGFDCGGQQHVYEIAFRTGDSVETNDGRDLAYMKDLLEMIEREGIPAPAPIEQRWSAGSSSPMSPVSNDGKDDAGPGLHSWIGIIMYLPTSVKETRDEITAAFKAYAKREEELLGEKYAIRTHWAKIESPGWYRGKTLEGADGLLKYDEGEHKARARAPEVARRELEVREEKELEANGKKLPDAVLEARKADHEKRLERLGREAGAAYREEQGKILEEVVRMRRTLARRYPVDSFNALRQALDPRGILANAMIENFFAPIDAYASQSTSHKKTLDDGFVVDAAPPEFILAIGRTLKRIERFWKPGSVWSFGGLLYDFETEPRATKTSEKEKKVLEAIDDFVVGRDAFPLREVVGVRGALRRVDARAVVNSDAEEEKRRRTETETETETKTKTKEEVEVESKSRRDGGYIRDKVNLARNVWYRGWTRGSGDGGGGPAVSPPPPL